jgi:uncharacterized protein YndB with AHSA1/START domain
MSETNLDTVPPVVRATWVSCTPKRAFDAFTDQIGAWWPLPTHSIHGDHAGGVAFAEGLLVERSLTGEESVWGEVLAWDPPGRVVFSWHPGDEPANASEVEVSFVPEGEGTRVVLEHRGWERFGDTAMARRRRYVGPGAWGNVLEHFADVAEDRVDAVVDLGPLRTAYDAFFAEAALGGFGEPEPGEWDAEQVLAHVALNDMAMTAIAHALVHRREGLRLENLVCQDREVMAHEIARAGSLEALVDAGRRAADVALVAVGRLNDDQLDTLVHCTLHHDGEIVLDQPMPWVQVAVHLQASRHLPAHTEQLANLRG